MIRDESGATAILVGLMATVLIGMMAFTADLGMAYANKRQLQTAADAAALSAAGVFATSLHADCSQIRADKLGDATSEAGSKVTLNTPSSGTAAMAASDFTAACTADGLEVTAKVKGTSPDLFGNLVGHSGDYAVSRTATAVVEPATGVGNRLRPLAVCSSEIDPALAPGDPFRIYAPGNGHTPPASCPVPPVDGNWWMLDCPGEHSDDGDDTSGTSALQAQIMNGCKDQVSIVDGQDAATSPSHLNSILANACPPIPTTRPFDCMSGDPGAPDAGHIEDGWQALIDSEALSFIPVFCAPPTCATSSVTGSGTSAVFPVHAFMAVTVCGYHFGKQPSKHYRDSSPGPICGASSVDAALDQMLLEKNGSGHPLMDTNYLVVVYQRAQASGSVDPSECDLGDTDCDKGVRQVRLTR
ncbi:pilus assembly protein TadG-related protein [Nocardioides pinisoli]|uniref:Pilus assembly protein TadG-related protein n=1 Tax=Nocardioides pinisoli TaxID=2950279 RepID=A0ABT1KUZ1_9ACTN|nr:pilus assembly protein TadG-related protein [Nocardioides pinisoli]MCP3421169.1 pilus assembly protein TadG-related protein [Nocardioides pinisoli]